MPPLLIAGDASARVVSKGRMEVRRPRLKATLADLESWFAVAAPGDALCYHRGFLAMDRAVGSRLGEEGRKELDRVAATVFALASAGRGHLVQRRHGDGDYEYIFIVASAPVCAAIRSLRLEVAP